MSDPCRRPLISYDEFRSRHGDHETLKLATDDPALGTKDRTVQDNVIKCIDEATALIYTMLAGVSVEKETKRGWCFDITHFRLYRSPSYASEQSIYRYEKALEQIAEVVDMHEKRKGQENHPKGSRGRSFSINFRGGGCC